jgi:hypothetical protein
VRSQVVGKEGTDDKELAMSEVDQSSKTEDDGDAQSDQQIDAARDEPIHQILK